MLPNVVEIEPVTTPPRKPRTLAWQPCGWLDDMVNLWKHFWYDDTPREVLRLAFAHRLTCAACIANGKAAREYARARMR